MTKQELKELVEEHKEYLREAMERRERSKRESERVIAKLDRLQRLFEQPR